MNTTKRKATIAWLFSLGWKSQAAIAIGLAVMVTIVFHALFGAITYIAIATTRTVAVVSTITNKFPEVKFFHTDYDVATNGARITMDIPDDASIGQWRIYRSEDLINWQAVYSDYTDAKSAEILMWTLYTVETNLTRCEAPRLFYKAEKDNEP